MKFHTMTDDENYIELDNVKDDDDLDDDSFEPDDDGGDDY
jgi:hypothetical protein